MSERAYQPMRNKDVSDADIDTTGRGVPDHR